MKVKTKSSYVATYYVINGGVVDKVEQTLLSNKERMKRNYRYEWCFHLSNVPEQAITAIKNNKAKCNVHLMAKTRIKIKKELTKQP